MFDGLIDILKDFFKWLVQPFKETLQDIFCWAIQFLVSLVSAVMALATSVFPSYPVPSVLRSGLSDIESVLDALNWAFPLGYAGGMMLTTFFIFCAYFILVPFYRAIMDLL